MTGTASFQTNDGVNIHYRHSFRVGQPCVILIHGFSGSSEYFCRNFDELARECSVVAYDLRGHGASGRPSHGYHVARLAADLHDLVLHLRAVHDAGPFVGVGCSIGAAVLWSYAELYTDADFAKLVFVDQAPLQNYTTDGSWGPDRGNYGCHDAASTARAQAALVTYFAAANRELVGSCLGYRCRPSDGDDLSAGRRRADEDFFTRISAQCEPAWIGKLMGNHTAYDHRDTIARCISVPTLVIAGRRSGCFPLAGSLETARLINSHHDGLAKTLEYDSGHWCYYEEPERFNRDILSFI